MGDLELNTRMDEDTIDDLTNVMDFAPAGDFLSTQSNVLFLFIVSHPLTVDDCVRCIPLLSPLNKWMSSYL